MKINKLVICVMVLFLLSGLTACGSGESKKTQIKFLNGKTESVDFMDELISAFNEQSDKYEVVQEFQKDASNALQTKLASGDVPDITSVDITQDYIDNGLFEDLSNEDYWENMDPTIKELVTDTKSGKQYKVATAKSIAGIFYNKDLAPDGLEYSSFDAFTKSIQKIMDENDGVCGLYLGGKDSWTLGQLMQLWGDGIIKEQYSITDAKTVFVDNEQDILKYAEENGPVSIFANRMLELQQDGIINSNATTASYDDQVSEFASGNVVAIPQGLWALSAIYEKNEDINIGFIPFPSMEDGENPVMLTGEDSTYAIPSQSENIEGAKEFLSYILKTENLKKYCEAMKCPCAYTNVDANWTDNTEEFTNASENSTAIGFTVFPSGFSGDDSGRYVQSLLSGQYASAEEFTKAYADAWNKAWDSNQ